MQKLVARCVGALALVAMPLMGTAAAQTAPLLKGAPLTHLGIVVPDINPVVKGYADIFGIPVPKIRTLTIDLPDGSKAVSKVAYVPMPNFYLEILQPVTQKGPISDYLKRYGLGVHHLGVGLDGNIDAVTAELQSKGGKWTGGKKGGAYTFVDLRHTEIGATLEVGPTARPEMPPAPVKQSALFGGRPISHVGLANTSAEASVRKYVEVFGMDPTPLRRFPPEGWFPYPPKSDWSRTTTVQTTQIKQAGINIELIQSIGAPTPWTHHIDKFKGTSIMHIAVGMGDIKRPDWLRIGQEKGGKWTNGGEDSFFAYLDWSEKLGLVIE